jgi:membrane-bound metal-dependent hydrolase YbcI (DUF457 family)
MPSPLGHTIVSSSIYLFFNRKFVLKRDWKFLVFSVLIGLLPDADLILVLIKNDVGIHRSVTHTLFFVILVALVISLIIKKLSSHSFNKIFTYISIFLFMHIVLDFFTRDEILHFGINLFYPFSGKYIGAPFYIFMGFDWRKISVLFSFYMFNVFLREILITAPMLLIVLFFRQKINLEKAG